MKKGLILCCALMLGLTLPLMAIATVKTLKLDKPQRLESEPTAAAPTVFRLFPKAVGTADLIGDLTPTSDCIWRTMSSPGGRNIALDAAGNIVVVWSKSATNGFNLFIQQYAYSTDGGTSWTSSNFFSPGVDTLRRCYSAVAVDGAGNPQFFLQAARRYGSTYCGFEIRYLYDQAGIGGGVLSTFLTLNDTAKATGTTPYNPTVAIRGDHIELLASDASGVEGDLSRDCHITARSTDLGASWVATPTGFPLDTTNLAIDPNWEPSNLAYLNHSSGYGGTVDPCMLAASADGQHLIDVVTMGGAVNRLTGDTCLEVPFFSYSDDYGATWSYGGALNPPDTTVPYNWVASDLVGGMAGGWFHLGSAVMDHNGIAHVVWSSYFSSKVVDNNGVPTVNYGDPMVHSYNTTPYDYSSWTHEQVGNRSEYDTVIGVWTCGMWFGCQAVDESNNIIFLFCDFYDMTGNWGLWAQAKGSDGTLHQPVLINSYDGVSCGQWCEMPEYITGDTVHCIWGYDGADFSGMTALMHSKFSITDLLAEPAIDQGYYLHTGVEGKPTGEVKTYGFKLNSCRPNPVRNAAELSFNLPAAGRYSLRVYNVAGQLVRDLSATGTAGPNRVNWNAKDNNGQSVANGVYLYNLSAFGNTATKKLVVVK